MEMAKGEIPNGPKDDYRDSLREKNGMRCEQPSPSSSLAISILIDEIWYSLPAFLDFCLQWRGRSNIKVLSHLSYILYCICHVDGFESEIT